MNKIIHGNSLNELAVLPENSIDSIVTDPPYELGFMGKKWDNTGIAYNVDLWRECLRVLKPGGHLLAFGGTRTYHRMACAIEDAGFDIRDMIEWIYSTGFPKSHNIGKSADKLQGNEREVVGKKIRGDVQKAKEKGVGYLADEANRNNIKQFGYGVETLTKGTSKYEGWGTALKPAHESICMARKPLSEKTVAENCLKWGTGGINIDESRVGINPDIDDKRLGGNGTWSSDKMAKNVYEGGYAGDRVGSSPLGRFPANLIHDNSEEVRECFPDSKSTANVRNNKASKNTSMSGDNLGHTSFGHNDSGNASRFFKSIIYQPKASKKERNAGCEGLEEKQYSHDGRDKEIENPYQRNKSVSSNNHATVKPVALMEYLIKMVTPAGGVVLDPFAGSGTTGVAAIKNGFQYLLIEMEAEHIEIIKARVGHAENNEAALNRIETHKNQLKLF